MLSTSKTRPLRPAAPLRRIRNRFRSTYRPCPTGATAQANFLQRHIRRNEPQAVTAAGYQATEEGRSGREFRREKLLHRGAVAVKS